MRSSSIKAIATALTVVITLSIGVPATARPARPKQQRESQIVRLIQRVKQFFGTIANALPTDPLPDQTQLTQPAPKPERGTDAPESN